MAVNPDFRDLFIAFNDAGVEYHLIRAKQAAGRPQDLLDLEKLQ